LASAFSSGRQLAPELSDRLNLFQLADVPAEGIGTGFSPYSLKKVEAVGFHFGPGMGMTTVRRTAGTSFSTVRPSFRGPQTIQSHFRS